MFIHTLIGPPIDFFVFPLWGAQEDSVLERSLLLQFFWTLPGKLELPGISAGTGRDRCNPLHLWACFRDFDHVPGLKMLAQLS